MSVAKKDFNTEAIVRSVLQKQRAKYEQQVQEDQKNFDKISAALRKARAARTTAQPH